MSAMLRPSGTSFRAVNNSLYLATPPEPDPRPAQLRGSLWPPGRAAIQSSVATAAPPPSVPFFNVARIKLQRETPPTPEGAAAQKRQQHAHTLVARQARIQEGVISTERPARHAHRVALLQTRKRYPPSPLNHREPRSQICHQMFGNHSRSLAKLHQSVQAGNPT